MQVIHPALSLEYAFNMLGIISTAKVQVLMVKQKQRNSLGSQLEL